MVRSLRCPGLLRPGSERDSFPCQDSHLATSPSLIAESVPSQSEDYMGPRELDDPRLAASSKVDAGSREGCSGGPAEVEADSDEAEDDLCPVRGDAGSSTNIVIWDLRGAGKRGGNLRPPDLDLGIVDASESDGQSPKGPESFEYEYECDSTWETVSASDLVPESRAGGSDSSKRIS
jgi:hypothetical protein